MTNPRPLAAIRARLQSGYPSARTTGEAYRYARDDLRRALAVAEALGRRLGAARTDAHRTRRASTKGPR